MKPAASARTEEAEPQNGEDALRERMVEVEERDARQTRAPSVDDLLV